MIAGSGNNSPTNIEQYGTATEFSVDWKQSVVSLLKIACVNKNRKNKKKKKKRNKNKRTPVPSNNNNNNNSDNF